MSDENKTECANGESLLNDGAVEPKKQILDLNNLHPEAQKRLEMLDLVTIDANGEPQVAPDEVLDSILRKPIHNEDPNSLADKYMMKHGLYESFKVDFFFLIKSISLFVDINNKNCFK
jgi:hypothetical protein